MQCESHFYLLTLRCSPDKPHLNTFTDALVLPEECAVIILDNYVYCAASDVTVSDRFTKAQHEDTVRQHIKSYGTKDDVETLSFSGKIVYTHTRTHSMQTQ